MGIYRAPAASLDGTPVPHGAAAQAFGIPGERCVPVKMRLACVCVCVSPLHFILQHFFWLLLFTGRLIHREP